MTDEWSVIQQMYTCFGSPREVWWLSEEDKRIQAARVLANNTGSDRQKRS